MFGCRFPDSTTCRLRHIADTFLHGLVPVNDQDRFVYFDASWSASVGRTAAVPGTAL
jgi:hypothetical protein